MLSAANQLGMTTTDTVTEGNFYQKLSSQQWDLVIIDIPNDKFTILDKPQFVAAIQGWIADGGRLIFNLTNLDEYPELWTPLGIAGTVEHTEPYEISARPPGNPLFSGGVGGFGFDAWDDNGDDLLMLPGGLECLYFEKPGLPTASVIYNARRTVCNGFDNESLSAASVPYLAQIQYVFSCHGDFDKDTSLTFFDFLTFINSFFSFQPRFCNVNFDTAVDLFDFTEFQSLFIQGCKE